MTKEEIQELFNHPPFDYLYGPIRSSDTEVNEEAIKKQSEEFRKFWHDKILDNDYGELSESDMNRVILFFDSTALDSKDFRDNGGVPAAKANINKILWHKALLALKHSQDIKEILNKIFIEKDDDIVIKLVDELERVNRGRGNGLTGAGTGILSAILFTYNPDRYLTMLLLNQRFALIDFFGFGDIHNYRSYGEKVIKTKNDIISGFKEKFGIDITPCKLSFFIYCQLNKKYNWNRNIKKDRTSASNNVNHYSEVNESDNIFQRERISDTVKREVWRRDGGKCTKCENRYKLEYDHIIPISRGGSNTVRNLELLCEGCNRKKSDKI